MNEQASIAICLAIMLGDRIKEVPRMLRECGYRSQDELLNAAYKHYADRHGEQYLDEFVKFAPTCYEVKENAINILGYNVYNAGEYAKTLERLKCAAEGFFEERKNKEKAREILDRLIPEENTPEWAEFKFDPREYLLKQKTSDDEWTLVGRLFDLAKNKDLRSDPKKTLYSQIN